MGAHGTTLHDVFIVVHSNFEKNSRTQSNPTGNEVYKNEREGNLLARFCVAVAQICISVGCHFTLENPRGSWMWRLPEFVDLANHAHVHFAFFPMCAFGTNYLKRTAFLTNAQWCMRSIGGLRCTCKKKHVILQGFTTDPSTGKRIKRTALAAAYPARLCKALVDAAANP